MEYCERCNYEFEDALEICGSELTHYQCPRCHSEDCFRSFKDWRKENKQLKEIINEIEILADKEITAMFSNDPIPVPVNIKVSPETIVKIKTLKGN